MKIDNTYDYIVDMGDHYSIAMLNINESLAIELDKRLHVGTTMFISGDLSSNVDIVVDGPIVANGAIAIKGIQASDIYFMRDATIDGNILSRSNIHIGRCNIKGDVVANNSIHFVSSAIIVGDISAAVNLVAKSSIKVSGNISTGGTLDAHSSIECNGGIRMAGKNVSKYCRYNNGRFTCVATDNVYSIFNDTLVAEVVEDIEDKAEDIMDLDREPTDREKFILSISSWIPGVTRKIIGR